MSLSNIEFEDHELLSERTLEFGNIVELTPLTKDDCATPWYRVIASLPIPSTQWESRDDYIKRAYLRQAADHLVFQSINSGLVRVYGAYPGRETLRMLPKVYFGMNRWWENCVKSGRYRPMNTFQDGTDGEERERRSDYLLYIRDADWTQAIENMLDRRRQFTGSVLDPQWRELGFGRAADAGARSTIYALGLEPPEAMRALTKMTTSASTDSEVPETEPAPPPLAKRRGRPPRYDWTGAMAALNELDGRDDLFRRIIEGEVLQVAAERFVIEWFAQRDAEPSESAVRERVTSTLQSRRESNAAKAGK